MHVSPIRNFYLSSLKMPRVSFNRLTRKRSSVKRRRTSASTRAKYLPKTRFANRSLIKQNASVIRAVRRMIPPPIWSDYQYKGAYGPFISGAPSNYFNIFASELMTPNALWQPVLRQDLNIQSASSTLVKRMSVNIRTSLGQSNWCQVTTFIVSLRKDAANRIVSQSGLTVDEDYILGEQDFNPRLNPSVFKVHYVRHLSLMSNAWQQNKTLIGTTEFVGNPNTTYAKGQVNIKPNIRLRQPVGTPWITMDQDQLPPHQRYFILTFFKGNTDAVDDDPPRVDWDALYTVYNAS